MGEKGRRLILIREQHSQSKWNFTFTKDIENGEEKAQHNILSQVNITSTRTAQGRKKKNTFASVFSPEDTPRSFELGI